MCPSRCSGTRDGCAEAVAGERSLSASSVLPDGAEGEGWDKLKKDIRAELDEDLLPQFHGTLSLPFAAGGAVKIVDDRGIESLKIVNPED